MLLMLMLNTNCGNNDYMSQCVGVADKGTGWDMYELTASKPMDV